MEKYLLFVAIIQGLLLTYFFAKKVSYANLSKLFFAVFLANFTLLNFRYFIYLEYGIKLTNFHLPFCFLAGPNIYHFIKFSFIPNIEIKYQRWQLWFLPSIIELILVLFYWMFYFINPEISNYFKLIIEQFPLVGTLYFFIFFAASIILLLRNNSIIKMNILYKKQYKLVKFVVFFILLMIIDNHFLPESTVVITIFFIIAFTSYFIFNLMNNSNYFSENDAQANEILKEALNEKEKSVLITNVNNTIVYVNQSLLELTGYKHKEIIGRKPTFLSGKLTTQESINYVKKQQEAKVAFEVDAITYHKSGKAFENNIIVQPIFNNKKITHFLAYLILKNLVSDAVPNEKEIVLFEKIKLYFETEKPYLNKQLQLTSISENLDLQTRQIGEIIKNQNNQSYTEFVNSYRINAVIEILKNKENHNLTIEAISQICGFNSKSAFNLAFKTKTGMTPKSYYEKL